MDAINLSDLRRDIDTLIDRIEAGDSVDIVRDGRPFARITPTPPVVAPPMPARGSFDLADLVALAEDLPFDPSNAGAIVRRMRDDARY